MVEENKNTSESWWSSNQMCFCAEYVKHILKGNVILTCSAAVSLLTERTKDGTRRRKGVKITNDK